MSALHPLRTPKSACTTPHAIAVLHRCADRAFAWIDHRLQSRGAGQLNLSAREQRVHDLPGTQDGNVYSPNIATDPYVIEEQRRVAQALRLSCEQFKTHCREAEQARRLVAEAEARR